MILFYSQAWKHDSTQIIITAITKWLSKKYFCFVALLKMFCSVYYQSQVHSKYFYLKVRLENIPWRLMVKTIYTCCTSIIPLGENIFLFHWLGLKTFCSSYYQANKFAVRLKKWFLKHFFFFCYPENPNKFQIFCQRADLIRQKSFSFFGKCFKRKQKFSIFQTQFTPPVKIS